MGVTRTHQNGSLDKFMQFLFMHSRYAIMHQVLECIIKSHKFIKRPDLTNLHKICHMHKNIALQ